MSFSKTRYWTHISKSIQKNHDGRAMIAAMEMGVLGGNALDARFRANERTMEFLLYHGEKPQKAGAHMIRAAVNATQSRKGCTWKIMNVSVSSRNMKRYRDAEWHPCQFCGHNH